MLNLLTHEYSVSCLDLRFLSSLMVIVLKTGKILGMAFVKTEESTDFQEVG